MAHHTLSYYASQNDLDAIIEYNCSLLSNSHYNRLLFLATSLSDYIVIPLLIGVIIYVKYAWQYIQ